jgi:hypothetical protein
MGDPREGRLADAGLMCPSAQPEMQGSVVFGIVGGTPDARQVAYLETPIAIDENTVALTTPLHPAEIFRIGAPCAGGACQHFRDDECKLAQRISQQLVPVVDALPRCALRPRCRWWKQEGKAACMRCPAVITRDAAPTTEILAVAPPESNGL